MARQQVLEEKMRMADTEKGLIEDKFESKLELMKRDLEMKDRELENI